MHQIDLSPPDSRATWVYFSAGAPDWSKEDPSPRDQESGWFAFWKACGRDEYGTWEIIARALEGLLAEDRFERMGAESKMCDGAATRVAYRTMCHRLTTLRNIKPCTVRDVCNWMDSHGDDAKYADPFIWVKGVRKDIPAGKI